jgi:N-methylhydantoinase A
MVKATRAVLNARGLDPHQHALISYGGCGSLFTAEIAKAIGAPRVVVPELASVLCAFGAATTDIRRERVHSLGVRLPVDAAALQVLAKQLETRVREDLAADGVATEDCAVMFEADLRFNRQISEISIRLPSGPIDDVALEEAIAQFRAEYAKRYGQGSIVLGAAMEFVTLRAIGIGRTTRASLETLARPQASTSARLIPKGARKVRIDRSEESAEDVRFFDGVSLLPGCTLQGPALVDSADTTIWIPAGVDAHVDAQGSLNLEVNS